MSLRYGAVNSDRCSIAAAASINDLTAWTHIVWMRPSGFGGGALRVWSKRTSSLQRHAGIIANPSGMLTVDVQRATTDGHFNTNELLVVDLWQCVAWTYDETDGPRCYLGSHYHPMAELTYSTRTVGAGATETDNAAPLYFGNRDTFTSAFLGQLAEQAHIARRLTLEEIQDWADYPDPTVPQTRVFIRHGENGTGTQTDLSGNGNHGTITGATLSFDCFDPLPPEYDDAEWLGEAPAAAAAFARIVGTRYALAGHGGLAA